MKNRLSNKFLTALSLLSVLIFSCQPQEMPKPEVLATGITLDKQEIALTKGAKDKLTATLTPAGVTDKTILWESSDAFVVAVKQDGEIMGAGAGTATVTARNGKVSASCKVTVSSAAAGVSLDKHELSIEKGQSHTLKATVSPADASDKTVTWTSSNPAVATVDKEGKVSALAVGEAEITAQAGSFTDKCKVTVVVSATGITLDKTELSLERGAKAKLTATLSPADATDKAISWESSEAFVVTVKQDGEIMAAGVGTATVTARCGKASATCKVTVYSTSTAIKLEKHEVILEKGASQTLKYTITPPDATTAVSWSSSNPAVATVDAAGKVTAVGPGSAEITVKSGENTDKCTVLVKISATGITLDKSTLEVEIKNGVGQTGQLTATLQPANATHVVEWTSADPSIATVNNGVVTAVKTGKTTVTASCGSYSAQCEVTVVIHTQKVEFFVSGNEYPMKKGEKQEKAVEYEITPSNSTDPISWSSSNENIVTVDQNGIATAKAVGSADVILTSGAVSARYKVTVTQDTQGITLSASEYTVQKGSTVTIKATLSPSDATDPIEWIITGDKTVASVNEKGELTGLKVGTTYVEVKSGFFKAECTVRVIPTGSVDLGLSVYWSAANLGASQASGSGDYYAWGETATKNSYTWANYKYANGNSPSSDGPGKLTKYNDDSSYGTKDSKKQLELGDDAARAKLGEEWRIPTRDEWKELEQNTTIELTADGIKLISKKNGNYILLPYGGYKDNSDLKESGARGFYWSSSLETASAVAHGSAASYIITKDGDSHRADLLRDRCLGLSIRPVYSRPK